MDMYRSFDDRKRTLCCRCLSNTQNCYTVKTTHIVHSRLLIGWHARHVVRRVWVRGSSPRLLLRQSLCWDPIGLSAHSLTIDQCHRFIQFGCFYSASSSPLLLRGAPYTERILCRS